jgi:hypothetical protein
VYSSPSICIVACWVMALYNLTGDCHWFSGEYAFISNSHEYGGSMFLQNTGDHQPSKQCHNTVDTQYGSLVLWIPHLFTYCHSGQSDACGRLKIKWKNYVLKVTLRQTNCETLNTTTWGALLMTTVISESSWSHGDVSFMEGRPLPM